MRIRTMLAASMLPGIILVSAASAEEDPCKSLLEKKEAVLAEMEKEQAALREQVQVLQSASVITKDELAQRQYRRLVEIGRDVKSQRQSMADFEGHVKWMSGTLSGYAKYVEAGSMAAGFARLLPIPYAGQASVLTKFVSQGLLSLKAASGAISRYLITSQQFVSRVDALDPTKPGAAREIAELGNFADQELLRDMGDARKKLAATAELSASSLSFLESLQSYLGSSDEYWNKTKSLLTRKEADKKEKGFLSESIQNLRNRAGAFNAKLLLFEETAGRSAPLIKSLGAYDELSRELEAKAAKGK